MGKGSFFIFFLALSNYVFTQCPTINDGNGDASNNPYWVHCFNTDYTLNFSSNENIGNYTIDWGDGSPIHSGTGLTPPSFVAHTYSAIIDTFDVVFTDLDNGCTVNGVVVMEEFVNASIQIPIGGVTQICAPGSMEFINASTNVSPTTNFTWDFGDGSPIQTYDHNNAGVTLSHMYLRNTVDCETEVRLTAENYCSNGVPTEASFNPVLIWDLDDPAITASATYLCYPDTLVHFDNTTEKNCINFGNTAQRYEAWNFGDYWGLGYDSIIPWQPYDAPTRPGYDIAFPGMGTYTITMQERSFCGDVQTDITVVIGPPPIAGITRDKDTVCVGEPVVFSNTTTGIANQIRFDFGDGSPFEWGGANKTHTYATPGTYEAVLRARNTNGTGSCQDYDTIQVVVLPSAVPNFTINTVNGCDSLTASFSNTSTGAIAWSWNFGNGNTSAAQFPPNQTYVGPGKYYISLEVENSNGCLRTLTDSLQVFASPEPNFFPKNVCQNVEALLTDSSVIDPDDPIVSWNWNLGDGNFSTDTNVIHTYTLNGTYPVNLQVATVNCTASETITLTVEPKPTANFSIDQDSACNPLTSSFTNQSVLATSFKWGFGSGDSSSLPNPTQTFTNSSLAQDSTYNIELIAFSAFGCSDTATSSVKVLYNPTASFSSNETLDCAPLLVDFVNTSVGAGSYLWQLDSSSSSATNPSFTFENQSLFIQNKPVKLIARGPNGCQDSTQKTITVYPEPIFTFSAVPDSGCSPLEVNFPSVLGAVSYAWNFGDGTTAAGANPTHTFTNTAPIAQSFTTQLIATNSFGCNDTSSENIVVYPKPTAGFSASSTAGCQPFNALFTNQSILADSFFWYVGTNLEQSDMGSNFNYIFTHNQPITQNPLISLIVQSAQGCLDTFQNTVAVQPLVQAIFEVDSQGCAPFTANFQNTSTGADNFVWNFDDGANSIEVSPSHLYNPPTPTNYNIQLTSSSNAGCSDDTTISIQVFQTPVADFVATPSSQQFPAATVHVTNNSSAGVFNYTWQFSDSAQSNLQHPPAFTYPTWGTYEIALKVFSDYCADSTTQQIEILPPVPIVDFAPNAQGCRPLSVQFENNTQYAASYLWDFGDGNTSTVEAPFYTYYTPGTYSVKLTATGFGGDVEQLTQTDIIEVHPVAIALFEHTPTTVKIPNQQVTFLNLSSNATTYAWDFGDGNTSFDENPVHFYQQEGLFDVTLVADNQYGCKDSNKVEGAVIAELEGSIVFPNAFTPTENTQNNGTYDPGALDNNVFYPITEGVKEYHLMVFNRWGELIFESFDLNVGWNGYYRGQPAKQDTYVWKVEATFINGDKYTDAGDVTLIR